MTREEIKGVLSEIEPYCFETNRKEYWYKMGCIDGLKAADAEPNLESLWHDASEEPIDNSQILYQDRLGVCWTASRQERFEYDWDWERFAFAHQMLRWAYINDLLPKGGEE